MAKIHELTSPRSALHPFCAHKMCKITVQRDKEKQIDPTRVEGHKFKPSHLGIFYNEKTRSFECRTSGTLLQEALDSARIPGASSKLEI